MKRNFKLLVAVVVLVATVFTLASCAAIQGFIDKLKPEQPVHEHTFSEEWSYDETNHWHAATCTDTEECATATSNVTAHSYYANGHCSVCGAVDPEYVPPVPECTEHSYSVEETKAPTCTEDGEKTFTCDECGYSYTQAVAALGHTEEKVEGTASTCTETGLSDGKVCTVCEEITKAQVTINATGHNYVEGTCSACGAEDPDYNGSKTYVFDAQALTEFAASANNLGKILEGGFDKFFTFFMSDKTKVESNKNATFSDGYSVSGGLRLNLNGSTAIQTTPEGATEPINKNALMFSIPEGHTATVKVWWTCGGDGREVAIFDEDGKMIAASVHNDPFAENEGTGSAKNATYVDTLSINGDGVYYLGTDNETNAVKSGGNIWWKVEVTVIPAEEEPANEIEATTTDNNCWVDKVTFTAQGEGNYTFSLPAGLGAWEVNDCDAWPPVNGPYVDYYNNAAGETFTVGLEAGATLEFYIGSESKQNWVIEWTYEACDVEGGGSVGGGEVTDNEELALGENSIVLGEEHAVDGKDYTFVVTEAGTYTFASDSLLAIVFDSTGMQLGRYQVTLEAGTYTVKLISMAGAGTYSVNVTVATAGGDDGSDTPTEPDGSEENPYVWETLPESATAEGDEINMIYYTFTATQSVPLTVTYSTANSWWTLTDKTDPSLSTQGSQSAENTMTLVAGHEYVLGLGVWSAEETDPTVTISLGDPIDPETCVHEWSQVWYHEDIVSATCTTPGAAVYRCDICKTYKTEATEINPDGHNYVTNTETYVAPTCQTDGYREATCSYCNDHQEYELSSEDYGFHDMVVDKEEYPTCTAAGCYIAHCQTEGCDYSVNDTYDPNGHYNYYLTCGQSGECLECGETFTKEHNLVWNPATCTEAAFCWDCNSSVGEPLGHDFVDGVCTVCEEADPNYSACEHSYFYACDAHCQVCGELTNANAAHSIVHSDAVAGTDCQTWDGTVEYWYCSDCGACWLDKALTQQTNRMNLVTTGAHSYFYACDKICQVCYELTNEDAAHTIVAVDAKDATCTENGNIAYWYCSDCGYAWADEALTQQTNQMSIVTPATGHADKDGNFKCDSCSTAMLPEDGEALTIPQAIAIAQIAGSSYTTQKYYITGIVTGLYNTTYGNFYIEDEDGNEICIYGLYSADGTTRYDAMSYKPVNGDEVTVYTVLGTYNSTSQGKNAWLDEVVAHEHDYSDATCKVLATCSVCGATTGELSTNHNYVNGICTVCDGVDPDFSGEIETGKIVAFEINSTQFDSTSYANNNTTKTVNGYSYTSYQVYKKNSSSENQMQWQKNKSYITVDETNAKGIVKIEISIVAGTYTVTVGDTTVAGTTVDGVTTYDLTGLSGEIKIAESSETGYTNYIKFYK